MGRCKVFAGNVTILMQKLKAEDKPDQWPVYSSCLNKRLLQRRLRLSYPRQGRLEG
jgi:hypothetical protein